MASLEKMSAAAQSIIDHHLDAIESSLRESGMTRSERSNILEDVENQIREMLEERTSGAPQENEVRAVIAELDAPESYLSPQDTETPRPALPETTTPPPSPCHLSKCAVIGALWAIPFFVWALFLVIPAEYVPIGMLGVFMTGSAWSAKWLLPAVTAPFVTTLLGIIAISQIRHSQGRLYGRGLAVGATLLFPLLAALPLCLRVTAVAFAFLNRPNEIFDPSYNHGLAWLLSMPLLWLLAVLFWMLVALAVTRWTWRYSGKPLPNGA